MKILAEGLKAAGSHLKHGLPGPPAPVRRLFT
jgi:hypothetical protein